MKKYNMRKAQTNSPSEEKVSLELEHSLTLPYTSYVVCVNSIHITRLLIRNISIFRIQFANSLTWARSPHKAAL